MIAKLTFYFWDNKKRGEEALNQLVNVIKCDDDQITYKVITTVITHPTVKKFESQLQIKSGDIITNNVNKENLKIEYL